MQGLRSETPSVSSEAPSHLCRGNNQEVIGLRFYTRDPREQDPATCFEGCDRDFSKVFKRQRDISLL